MAAKVSEYFNHVGFEPEQDLVEMLSIEVIQQRGVAITYIIRDGFNDQLYKENKTFEYSNHNDIEMLILSFVAGSQGSSIFAKFGYEMKDTMRLEVSVSRFKEEFESYGRKTPKRDDLIYIPMADELFVITDIELDDDDSYYTIGKNYSMILVCEPYTFNHDKINTGIPMIDDISDDFEYTLELTENLFGSSAPGEINDELDVDNPNMNFIIEDENNQGGFI